MNWDSATLSYQRWQVALAIRDGQWRSLEEISGLVEFDAGPCLMDEERGSKNFKRVGRRWKMQPKAIKALEANENREPVKPKYRKPGAAHVRKVYGTKKKKKQRNLFK